jgi:hypothetical protein
MGYGLVRICLRSISLLPSQVTRHLRFHLIIYNSWKSAYYYADWHGADFENYYTYAATSIRFLVEHHDTEEKALFLKLAKEYPEAMEGNHAQHKSFIDAVRYGIM